VGLNCVDACLIVYAFEDHPRHGAAVRERLSAAAADSVAISPLVQLECLVGPIGAGNLVLQRYCEDGLRQLVNLPLLEAVFLQAARPRAHCGLELPDNTHLEAAHYHRYRALRTKDDRQAQGARGQAFNMLSQA
jgi:predicted nucleic acid-binding protein